MWIKFAREKGYVLASCGFPMYPWLTSIALKISAIPEHIWMHKGFLTTECLLLVFYPCQRKGRVSLAISICSKDFLFQLSRWSPEHCLQDVWLWDYYEEKMAHILKDFQLLSVGFYTSTSIRLVPKWSTSNRNGFWVSTEIHLSSFHILESQFTVWVSITFNG